LTVADDSFWSPYNQLPSTIKFREPGEKSSGFLFSLRVRPLFDVRKETLARPEGRPSPLNDAAE
jgi:hypothetical protein